MSKTPRSTLAHAVGMNLERRRTENGMTQVQAAEQLERDVASISTTERGLRSFLISTVEDLAEILEVEPFWPSRP